MDRGTLGLGPSLLLLTSAFFIAFFLFFLLVFKKLCACGIVYRTVSCLALPYSLAVRLHYANESRGFFLVQEIENCIYLFISCATRHRRCCLNDIAFQKLLLLL